MVIGVGEVSILSEAADMGDDITLREDVISGVIHMVSRLMIDKTPVTEGQAYRAQRRML